MKKLIYSLVITLLMGLSVNAFAQNPKTATIAYLNAKTAKKVVDDKTAIITFKLNNISDATTMQKYKTAFSKYQRVQDVSATMQTGNMASYSVKMDKIGSGSALQGMLKAIGVESVNIDGKVIATKELANYKGAKK